MFGSQKNIRSKILYIKDTYGNTCTLSEDFENLANHLANGGTVSLYEPALKVIDECINCINLLKIKNIDNSKTNEISETRAVNTDSDNLDNSSNLDAKELKNLFKQYKKDLLSGDALVTVTQEQIDQNADIKPITRRGKCKIYCKLLIRDVLKVAGTLCVDGDGVIKFLRVTTDAVVSGRLNVGSLFINGQPVSANASGNISGTGSSIENGIAIFTDTSGRIIESSNIVIDNGNNLRGVNNLFVNGEIVSNGSITLTDGNALRFEAPVTRQTGNDSVNIKAPNSIQESYTIALPGSPPVSSGQVLQVSSIDDSVISTEWEDASGSVSGPDSSDNNAVALFNGESGDLLKQSPAPVTIDSSNDIHGLRDIYLPNTSSATSSVNISDGIVYKDGIPFLHNAGTNNTFLGLESGTSTTTGDANVAVGRDALLSNTTGRSNVAAGVSALLRNTDGGFNCAVGRDALLDNTAGESNVAVGASALLRNTDGGFNCAVGRDALLSNTTGESNVAVGASALLGNKTGQSNIAVGRGTLFNNTDGGSNVALGRGALLSNTIGGFNIAVGRRALSGNKTGQHNIAIGRSALFNNDTGKFNVAVGRRALFDVVGESNIAIGTRSGESLTSGSSNIYIGNSGASSESNTTRIGDNQTDCFIAGIGSVTTATTPVCIDTTTGQLGTGCSSRRYKKDIKDIGEITDNLKELRPVTFKYKSDESNKTQYGLIAEDVDKAGFKDLVVYKDGKPESVKYHLLSSMLLNEVKKLMISQQVQDEKINKLIRQISQLKKLNQLKQEK